MTDRPRARTPSPVPLLAFSQRQQDHLYYLLRHLPTAIEQAPPHLRDLYLRLLDDVLRLARHHRRV